MTGQEVRVQNLPFASREVGGRGIWLIKNSMVLEMAKKSMFIRSHKDPKLETQ